MMIYSPIDSIPCIFKLKMQLPGWSAVDQAIEPVGATLSELRVDAPSGLPLHSRLLQVSLFQVGADSDGHGVASERRHWHAVVAGTADTGCAKRVAT